MCTITTTTTTTVKMSHSASQMNANREKEIEAGKSFKTLYDQSMVNDGACTANKAKVEAAKNTRCKMWREEIQNAFSNNNNNIRNFLFVLEHGCGSESNKSLANREQRARERRNEALEAQKSHTIRFGRYTLANINITNNLLLLLLLPHAHIIKSIAIAITRQNQQ